MRRLFSALLKVETFAVANRLLSVKGGSIGRTVDDDFVVIDCETTGLNSASDRIVSIAAIRYSGGKEVDSLYTLVNPHRRIPPEASRVNGITNDMVKDAPDFDKVLPDLLHLIGECKTLAAHNATFDLQFIGAQLRRCGRTLEYSYIDTLSLARRSFPELPNHKLSTVAAPLGITGNWHWALDDARAAGQIALHCISLAESLAKEKYTPEELAGIRAVKEVLAANRKRWDLVTCARSSSYVALKYAGCDLLRLKLSGRLRCVIPCNGLAGIDGLASGFSVEGAPKSTNAAVKVLVEGVDDLTRLKPLILAS